MNHRHFENILSVSPPEALLDEVLQILRLISSDFNTEPIRDIFETTSRIYGGAYPGYRACNTAYHDLGHANATFLAMARLIHGAVLEGETLSESEIVAGLTAAILHDVGYIQQASDTQGTGAKYKVVHEQRSMDFLGRHGPEFGLSSEQIAAGQSIILCTKMAADMAAIAFPSAGIRLLGKLLGAADLLAQLADRAYLEKLLYLYRECKEAGTGEFKNELEVFKKTVEFYDVFELRLKTVLDQSDRFMQPHFAARWNIDKDLYREAILGHQDFLRKALKMKDPDLRRYLKDSGIVN